MKRHKFRVMESKVPDTNIILTFKILLRIAAFKIYVEIYSLLQKCS